MSEITNETSENLEDYSVIKLENPADAIDPKISNIICNTNLSEYLIEFDDTKVISRQSRDYPNPTANHFTLARHLSNIMTSPKFIDLGCGVGFLGNYAGVRLDIEEIIFADLNQGAIDQALNSYETNHKLNLKKYKQEQHDHGIKILGSKHTLDTRVGNAAESLKNYDAEGCIAVAAPMYVPGICEEFPQAFDLFAEVAKNTGADLYIGHSSLTLDLIEKAAHESGLKLLSEEKKTIPFIIEYTDGRTNLTQEHLVAKGLIIKNDKSYHKLMVSKLYHK